MQATIHKKMESIKNIRYDRDVDNITTVNYTSVMPVQNTLLTYTRTALQNHTPQRYAPTYLRVPVKFWTSIMFMWQPTASPVIILGESHTVTTVTMLDAQILLHISTKSPENTTGNPSNDGQP
jgi:hypothetical protein